MGTGCSDHGYKIPVVTAMTQAGEGPLACVAGRGRPGEMLYVTKVSFLDTQ